MKTFIQEHNLRSDYAFALFAYAYRENCILFFSALSFLSLTAFCSDHCQMGIASSVLHQ